MSGSGGSSPPQSSRKEPRHDPLSNVTLRASDVRRHDEAIVAGMVVGDSNSIVLRSENARRAQPYRVMRKGHLFRNIIILAAAAYVAARYYGIDLITLLHKVLRQ